MSLVTLPNLGPDPFTVNASVLNGKVDPLATDYNGNIQNVNIAAGAGIVYSKLSLTDGIVNADINSSAAIASTKLDLSAVAQNFVTTKIIKEGKGADVASVAGAITLGDDGNYFDITGTNAITSITAKTAGTMVTLQFDSTASLVDGSNLKLNGNFNGAAESTITLRSDGTNWFEVSRSPLSYTPTAANALSGSVLQVQYHLNVTKSTGTTAIPLDDSIPQNTEGDEYLTKAITPSNSSNILRIDVVMYGDASAGGAMQMALFQDSTAGALSAVGKTISGGNLNGPMVLTHFMTAGTTSETTFKVRAGGTSGTFTINGYGGNRIYGGVLASTLTITEIKA